MTESNLCAGWHKLFAIASKTNGTIVDMWMEDFSMLSFKKTTEFMWLTSILQFLKHIFGHHSVITFFFFNNVWDMMKTCKSIHCFYFLWGISYWWCSMLCMFSWLSFGSQLVQCLMLSSRKTTYYHVCIGGGGSISTLTSVFFFMWEWVGVFDTVA